MTVSNAFQGELEKSKQEDSARSIKVVVWDLDNTLWDGVLLEGDPIVIKSQTLDVIKALDQRGILQSISSKNDLATAVAKLKEHGLCEYFIYPQIGWNAKSAAVHNIASNINVGLDTLAFIDDQIFEREEVAYCHPSVLCLDVCEIPHLLDRPEFMPRFITSDSANRRTMYMDDIKRNTLEGDFTGPKDEFLATLHLELTLAKATENDLQRAEELTRRTHQLNTTGYTYNFDELRGFMDSPDHDLIIAGLIDKFGSYGSIGLCLVERHVTFWTLKLLLMSCRVMSRGVGTIMLSHIVNMANEAGVALRAEFIRTDRNRMMLITYRLANFKVLTESDAVVLLENECSSKQAFPPYISVHTHC